MGNVSDAYSWIKPLQCHHHTVTVKGTEMFCVVFTKCVKLMYAGKVVCPTCLHVLPGNELS